jgi:hypothetical protein
MLRPAPACHTAAPSQGALRVQRRIRSVGSRPRQGWVPAHCVHRPTDSLAAAEGELMVLPIVDANCIGIPRRSIQSSPQQQNQEHLLKKS